MPPPWTVPRIPGLRRFFRLPSAERDVHALVDDEIAFHVDMLAEELAAEGHPPEAARREALRRFGNLHGVRRRCYEISLSHATTMRRHELLSSVWQDVVYAARGMRRARGFSVVVLLTLALGIGATTAMFSVVRGVLLRPLPFPDAERVVRLWPGNPNAGTERPIISAAELEDWERELRGFEAVGAFGVTTMNSLKPWAAARRSAPRRWPTCRCRRGRRWKRRAIPVCRSTSSRCAAPPAP